MPWVPSNHPDVILALVARIQARFGITVVNVLLVVTCLDPWHKGEDDAEREGYVGTMDASDQAALASATAILPATRALFSTNAILVVRLRPSVISKMLASRNGVTALPEIPLASARSSAWRI